MIDKLKKTMKYCIFWELDRIECDVYDQTNKEFQLFGRDISALTYFVWEKIIDEIHPFMAKISYPCKYYTFFETNKN